MKEIWRILMYILVGILLCLNIYQYRTLQGKILPCSVYSDTLTVVDTIPYYQPIPRDSVIIRYVTISKELTQEDCMKNDSTATSSDSVTIEIPIVQKVYKDSKYTAYISGYHPQLDSLILYPQTNYINTFRHSKCKRWSIGLQVGYGLNLQKHPQFTPYIGIGISYNLFKF